MKTKIDKIVFLLGMTPVNIPAFTIFYHQKNKAAKMSSNCGHANGKLSICTPL